MDDQLEEEAVVHSTARIKKKSKRTRENDFKLQNISTQMVEVAMALQKISKSKLDVDLLYQEVMKIEEFEE